jgi:hypothetical protein
MPSFSFWACVAGIDRKVTRCGGRSVPVAMHDVLLAEFDAVGGLWRCLRDHTVGPVMVRLMKTPGFEPSLKLALPLLIPRGAHRQLVPETMYMRDVATPRPTRQRKPSREQCRIFLGHLRSAACGRERRRGALVLFFFDLHVCLVVGVDPMRRVVRPTFSHTLSNCRPIPNQVSVYQRDIVNS